VGVKEETSETMIRGKPLSLGPEEGREYGTQKRPKEKKSQKNNKLKKRGGRERKMNEGNEIGFRWARM